MTTSHDRTGTGTSQPAWYCVRAQPHRDHIAAANLRRHRRLEVLDPRIRFRRPTRRGPVWVTEPLFPGYLFARFEKNAMLPEVQHTLGVAGVVHFGSFWPIIPEPVIEELRAAIGEQGVRTVAGTLREGDEVRISGGPFDGFRAVVSRVMPARQRVAVLLDFLGSQTVLDVECGLVVTETAWASVRAASVAAARLALR